MADRREPAIAWAEPGSARPSPWRVMVVYALAVLALGCHRSPGKLGEPPPPGRRFHRIDVHTHISPDGVERAVRLMNEWGIDGMVNLSGMHPGPPHNALQTQLAAAAQSGGRIAVFTTPDFKLVRRVQNYGAAMADQLTEAHRLGAIGLKITKGLGLGYTDAQRKLVAIDDKGLDPLFETAGRLKMPITIHSGDPKAFWLPPTRANERWDELVVHPRWSFYGFPVSWQDLFDQFERRVARHPKTIFIGAHFGNDPEDPDNVARMLDKHKNLYIDTAARVPEIGRVDARHDAGRMRAFFERYQDRILFGTDTGVGENPEDLMLGSTGATPPGPADVERFFDSTWRWFETGEKNIPTPTPIQGRWNVDGIALPQPILEKVYHANAERVIGVKLP